MKKIFSRVLVSGEGLERCPDCRERRVQPRILGDLAPRWNSSARWPSRIESESERHSGPVYSPKSLQLDSATVYVQLPAARPQLEL